MKRMAEMGNGIPQYFGMGVILLGVILLGLSVQPMVGSAQTSETQTPRDLQSDTWIAEDALGRKLPGYEEVGPPREDRTVAMFYFLWLGAHEANGPKDITKILAEDPDAMSKPDSPLWGPLHAAHHWGESIFGYYRTDDPYVLRKHAQLLSEAGVDVVIFDVTNQITYKEYYEALCETWTQIRREGGKTPQIAFLTPFWAPKNVVHKLYEDLYNPGRYRELWFMWDGKPFILADPDFITGSGFTFETSEIPVKIESEQMSLGQTFTVDKPLLYVAGRFPTWEKTDSMVTLSLYENGPDGKQILTKQFKNVRDCAWLELRPDEPLPVGTYYLEATKAKGDIGWWTAKEKRFDGGVPYTNGKPTSDGCRDVRVGLAMDETQEILDFFTFRRPQPDYFAGQTKPDMWSWLEVYPQHLFINSRGEREQMAVGVAQNAVDGKLATLSAPGAHGRSFTFEKGDRDQEPNASRFGYNFSEQFDRALNEDPRAIFITGWNEWIAGRFDEFHGVRLPVMFVDQFNMEHSRDIEPSKSEIGDDYYYQLVSYVRRYKGVQPTPTASGTKTIDVAGAWTQWEDVYPEYRDDRADPAKRDHDGYNKWTRYTNDTGRNDLLNMKVAEDSEHIYFYVETAETLIPGKNTDGLFCLVDVDRSRDTGWEGFDYRIDVDGVQRWDDSNQSWSLCGTVDGKIENGRMMVAVERNAFAEKIDGFGFKWVDHIELDDIMKFYTDGDVAPEGRYQYSWR